MVQERNNKGDGGSLKNRRKKFFSETDMTWSQT